jgi:hypothetical protein
MIDKNSFFHRRHFKIARSAQLQFFVFRFSFLILLKSTALSIESPLAEGLVIGKGVYIAADFSQSPGCPAVDLNHFGLL